MSEQSNRAESSNRQTRVKIETDLRKVAKKDYSVFSPAINCVRVLPTDAPGNALACATDGRKAVAVLCGGELDRAVLIPRDALPATKKEMTGAVRLDGDRWEIGGTRLCEAAKAAPGKTLRFPKIGGVVEPVSPGSLSCILEIDPQCLADVAAALVSEDDRKRGRNLRLQLLVPRRDKTIDWLYWPRVAEVAKAVAGKLDDAKAAGQLGAVRIGIRVGHELPYDWLLDAGDAGDDADDSGQKVYAASVTCQPADDPGDVAEKLLRMATDQALAQTAATSGVLLVNGNRGIGMIALAEFVQGSGWLVAEQFNHRLAVLRDLERRGAEREKLEREAADQKAAEAQQGTERQAIEQDEPTAA